jgi:hypothetical protein
MGSLSVTTVCAGTLFMVLSGAVVYGAMKFVTSMEPE